MHDVVVERSWKLLSQPEENVPSALKDIRLPVLATKRALERLRGDTTSRPGGLVKQALQDQLHKEFTFQNPENVQLAARMLGVDDFWRQIAKEMPGHPKPGELTDELRQIVRRRNQIVHEADLIRKTKGKGLTTRTIARETVGGWIKWIRNLGEAITKVI